MLLRITFCEMAPAPATARPSARTPMLRAREAAAETALIVAAVTPNFPDVGSNARTKLAPSGASTTQRWPSTRVETLRLSVSSHFVVSL